MYPADFRESLWKATSRDEYLYHEYIVGGLLPPSEAKVVITTVAFHHQNGIFYLCICLFVDLFYSFIYLVFFILYRWVGLFSYANLLS